MIEQEQMNYTRHPACQGISLIQIIQDTVGGKQKIAEDQWAGNEKQIKNKIIMKSILKAWVQVQLLGSVYKIENNKDKNIFDSINAGLGFLFAEVTGSVKDLLGREDEQYFFLQISL